MKECDRCGDKTSTLEPIDFQDDYGEDVHWLICIECINEIANGAPLMEDDYDIYMRRREQEYNEDPVNTPYPWWN